MEPYIYIEIEANIHTHKKQVNKYLITLEQHDNEWVWTIQGRYEKNHTQQSLKHYIDHITQRKWIYIKNFIQRITQQKNKYIAQILKHQGHIYIIHQDKSIHVGKIYISKNNITLYATASGNAIHIYDISILTTETPKALQHYLQQHIPIENIINYHKKFPNQHEQHKNILLHYHPRISMHIPCAITSVNTTEKKHIDQACKNPYNIHNTPTHEALSLLSAPRMKNTKSSTNIFTYFKNIPDIYNTPNPTDQSTQHIEHIKQYLHEIFIPSPLFQQSSHHDQIRMLRAIQQHGDIIAQDIYTAAIAHLQHRRQVIDLTLPNIKKKYAPTKFLRNILAWISKT